MRLHVEHVAFFQRVRFAGEKELAFTGKDLNQRVLRGGVLGQFLAFGKAKQDNAGIVRAQQRPADDAIGSKSGFSFERENFFLPRIN